MSRFLLRLADCLRFRAGPQDMPPGWAVAVLLTLLYVVQAFAADHLLEGSTQAPRSLVAIGIQFAATAAILRVRGLSARLPQTLTTLAATGLFFGIASILMVLQASPGQAQPVLVLLWLGTFLWSLAVDGHIYRHALSTTMSFGMLVAVLIFALNFIVIESLFPTPASNG